MNKNISVFDNSAKAYDKWFSENPLIFKSEVLALKQFLPKKGLGLEVGVGTGRFAKKLGVKMGVEPSPNMAKLAHKRGIKVIEGLAESLPFTGNKFDFVLFVTTLCFVKYPLKALKEAHRVLKPGGILIVGIIDKDTPLGKKYEKSKSPFYQFAHFIRGTQLEKWLRRLKFEEIKSCQTLIKKPKNLEIPTPGHGKGGFAVFSGQKRNKLPI